MSFTIRLAVLSDIPALERLIPLSAKTLQADHYSQDLIEAALGPIFAVDSQLIADGTYFVAESQGQIVGCGGWSKRDRPFGGGADAPLLDSKKHAAHIRAFFVHPDFARQGIGSAIMQASEDAARQEGFRKLELVATLPGEPLYARFGFIAEERYEISASEGLMMPVVRMTKT